MSPVADPPADTMGERLEAPQGFVTRKTSASAAPRATPPPAEPRRRTGRCRWRRVSDYREGMADALDLDAMLQRFRDRAQAVKDRPLPPIAGEERTRFIEQAQIDFQDFAIIGDAPPASTTACSR